MQWCLGIQQRHGHEHSELFKEPSFYLSQPFRIGVATVEYGEVVMRPRISFQLKPELCQTMSTLRSIYDYTKYAQQHQKE